MNPKDQALEEFETMIKSFISESTKEMNRCNREQQRDDSDILLRETGERLAYKTILNSNGYRNLKEALASANKEKEALAVLVVKGDREVEELRKFIAEQKETISEGFKLNEEKNKEISGLKNKLRLRYVTCQDNYDCQKVIELQQQLATQREETAKDEVMWLHNTIKILNDRRHTSNYPIEAVYKECMNHLQKRLKSKYLKSKSKRGKQ
jgi:hypothetical protein